MEPVKIHCQNPRTDRSGQPCGRWLATLQGEVLSIYCPKCKGLHEIPLSDLIYGMFREAVLGDSSPKSRFYFGLRQRRLTNILRQKSFISGAVVKDKRVIDIELLDWYL